jgi:hypothetical protein
MNFFHASHRLFPRFVCVLLAFVMATAPSAAVIAQTNPGQPPAQAAEAGRIDLSYVSPGAVVIVILRPAQIMSSQMAEMLPTEVASAAGLKYLGFDPADVEEVIAFAEQFNPAAPPQYGLVIRFTKPIRGSSINPQIRAHTQLSELGGKRYLQSQNPTLPSFYSPTNQVLVVAPDATLRRLVESAGQPQRGRILDRVKNVASGSDLYAAVDVESLRPLIMMGLAQAQAEVPPEARPFLEAPNLIRAAELTFNLSGFPTSLVVHANDDAAGQRLEELMTLAMSMYQEQMGAQFAEQAMSEDPVERAMAQYMERISGRWMEPFMPQRDGASLTFFKAGEDAAAGQQQLTNVAVIGILVALLLPAIQAAREAARRNQSMNQMRQLIISLLNYENATKAYPAHASYSSDGKPLLSWRVHILPYLEEQALYEQFKLDEPWDSEHNRALIAQMPAVFQNPNLPDETGKTNYLAVVGEVCVFSGTQTGLKPAEIIDGTSNTIVLVEAARDQAVEWTKPDDWEYNPANPKAGLGGIRPGGWIAGFADGSVHFISQEIDEGALKAMFTRAGGEEVPPGAF